MRFFLPALGAAFLFPQVAPAPAGSLPAPSSLSTAQSKFPTSVDIGTSQRGSAEFSAERSAYRLSGGGDDLWGAHDAFRFSYTAWSGNADFAADVHMEAPTTSPLAKALLMVRQSLDPGSPYADIALHADGHLTLQYRLEQGGETRDILLPAYNPHHLRLMREGNRFTASVVFNEASPSAKSRAASIELPLRDPVLIGLGVCSHNTDVLQNVTFDQLSLRSLSHF